MQRGCAHKTHDICSEHMNMSVLILDWRFCFGVVHVPCSTQHSHASQHHIHHHNNMDTRHGVSSAACSRLRQILITGINGSPDGLPHTRGRVVICLRPPCPFCCGDCSVEFQTNIWVVAVRALQVHWEGFRGPNQILFIEFRHTVVCGCVQTVRQTAQCTGIQGAYEMHTHLMICLLFSSA